MVILRRHLAQTGTTDAITLAADYAPDACLHAHDGDVHGREAIGAWFVERRDFFQALDLRLERLEARPGFASVDWWARAGSRAFAGRDEFEIDADGLIAEQRIVAVGKTDREFRNLRVEVEPPIMRIVLDREEKRNAVSLPMLTIMSEALAEAADDEGIRAVFLAGEGTGFCAGEDVGGFEFPDVATARQFLDGPLGFFTALEVLPKPVVAAVHGHAFGFGSEVLLACDLTVAHPDARFGFAEIDHGAVPSVLVTRGLDTTFRRRALYLALTGRRFGVDEAMPARLIHRVEDDYLAAAELAAREMATWSPAAVALVKGLLGADTREDHDRARDFMPSVLLQVEPSI
jgi:enoyl-CoA hydratase/carnithine racemase